MRAITGFSLLALTTAVALAAWHAKPSTKIPQGTKPNLSQRLTDSFLSMSLPKATPQEIALTMKNPAEAGCMGFTDKRRPGVQTMMAVEKTVVRGDISGFGARVTVTQIFLNPSDTPIEAIYTFPLPNDAAVDSMRMKIGDRLIVGKIKSRDEARTIYETAKNNGQAAALLDQERPNIFTQSVANVMPKARIAVIVFVYLVYTVREILVPLGLAFLVAMVLDPVVNRMEVRGWKRGPATMFIFGSFIFILIGFAWLTIPYAIAQGADLQKKFEVYFPDGSHKGILASLHKLNAPDWLANAGAQIIQGAQSALAKSSTLLTKYGVGLLSNLIWLVIVPIVAFYSLRDFHLILVKSLLLVPARHRDNFQSYVIEVSSIFAKFLRGLAIVSVLNGVATWLLLTVIGIPGSLVLGIVAGILYSVPYVGAMITIVLTAAIAFAGGGVGSMALAVGLSIVLHQVIFDQIISPRILGGQVGLHPLLAIVALLSGNILLGIVGMILAVPVAACIQMGVLAALPKLQIDVEMPEPQVTPAPLVPDEHPVTNEEGNKPPDVTQEMHQNLKDAVELAEVKASDSEVEKGSA